VSFDSEVISFSISGAVWVVVFPEPVWGPVVVVASLHEVAVWVVPLREPVWLPVEPVASPHEGAVWAVVFPDSVGSALRVFLVSCVCHLMWRK
jgi:hypothetical protein